MKYYVTTKHALAHALFTQMQFDGKPVLVLDERILRKGEALRPTSFVFLSVNSVEAEDGSGQSFNVTGITPDRKSRTVHVSTID